MHAERAALFFAEYFVALSLLLSLFQLIERSSKDNDDDYEIGLMKENNCFARHPCSFCVLVQFSKRLYFMGLRNVPMKITD